VILGLTPARGGSKGITRKNIRSLCGKPLLAWTIQAALQAKRLDKYVVSTEDSEVMEIARNWGAEVMERPPELATDEADTLGVIQDVLQRVPSKILVLLQATSPIRDSGVIDQCIERFIASGADSLATGFLCKHGEYGKPGPRRQDIPGFFVDDGNVYVMRADLALEGDRYGQIIERVVLDSEQNIDIDAEFDFWVAEQVLRKRSSM